MSKFEELLELVKANPDLPVIPIVDEEIVDCCGGSYWLGEWVHSEVTEYYKGKEMIHFKDDDQDDVLNDICGCEYGHDPKGRDIYDLSSEEWGELYASIPWVKAIVIWIR